MRKLKQVKIKYVLLMAVLLITVCFVCMYFIYTYNREDVVYIGDMKVIYKGNLTEKQKKEYEYWLDYAFERLPEALYKKFSQEQCIYIMDSKHFIAAHRKTGSENDAVAFLGLDKDENPVNIYINGDSILVQDCGMPATICHEFGHYMDYVYGKFSDSDRWNEISTAEAKKQKWYQEYYEAPVEFFAQIFATYCIDSSDPNSYSANRINCPMAWEYMAALVENYGEN